MVVQPMQRRELSLAKTALVSRAIPTSFRSEGLDVLVSGHGYHRLCNDVVYVPMLNCPVDFLPIASEDTATGFEVDNQSRCSGVGVSAEETGRVSALVFLRVQMLDQHSAVIMGNGR